MVVGVGIVWSNVSEMHQAHSQLRAYRMKSQDPIALHEGENSETPLRRVCVLDNKRGTDDKHSRQSLITLGHL